MDRRKSNAIGRTLSTKRIRIWGIVQGVGFRPFVAKMADSLAMKGCVRNLGGLVEIVLTDYSDAIENFIQVLKEGKPLPAEIVHISIEDLPLQHYESFTILASSEGEDEAAMIPADIAICPDCLREMQDPLNPRYRHPFISCMACGPRYTIIDRIPYDRENTAMIDFSMCSFCRCEYEDLRSRRFHAQTISCHDCGPYNKTDSDLIGQTVEALGHITDNESGLAYAIKMLKTGGVIAAKGIGGYNYMCSPFNDETVRALRQLKSREEKPFAVMFHDIDQIRGYCKVGREEEQLLLSRARPIVLLLRTSPGISDEVTRTSRFIGAFLPSTGLQYQLISACGPLISTSANRSEAPIIKDDAEMCLELAGVKATTSTMLYNDRAIRLRLDDSVVRVIDGKPQMIRRSKGYAPVPLLLQVEGIDKSDMILAAGGQLKSAFCLTKGNFAYVSQYLGDLDQQDGCSLYDEAIVRMKNLFGIEPGIVVCDLHPLYYTTKYAENYFAGIHANSDNQNGAEILRVQHHHAHVASVMAEHDLKGAVLGVSFDGTGYGPDGAVWGGEFLICGGEDYQRAAHLDYIRMIGGDASMKEGWKSAMCFTHAFNMDWPKSDERYTLIKAGIDHNINTIESSSMGRLFDAMAAFLGIHENNRYEGECAIMLENAAAEALEAGMAPLPMTFDITHQLGISAESIFKAALEGMNDGTHRQAIALGFHYAVADMILSVCRSIRAKSGISQIALTGGVFQNKILMERTLALLRREDFAVYYNISVGPNDGGICLGQAYIGMQYLANHDLRVKNI